MGQNRNIRLQKFVFVVAVFLLAVKFIAYFLTNSNAILTDALESIVNVAAGGFGLYSLVLAAKPRDEDHPYGHGKIEFISAGIEGSMICLAGSIIIGKSVYNFFYPHQVGQVATGLILIAAAGTVNFFTGKFIETKGRQTGSMTLIASGKHLQSDGWSTAGLLIGLIFLLIFRYSWIDSAVALIFGIYIIVQGLLIVRKSIGGIMDEADEKLLESIIHTLDANRRPNWVDLHNLRIIKYGTNLHFDCHITVPYYFSVREGHDEAEKMYEMVQNDFGNTEWFVHLDACVPPQMCRICIKSDCHLRQAAHEKRIPWNRENVLRNRKHGLE